MNQTETVNISNAGTVAENIDIQAQQVAGRDLYYFEMLELASNAKLKFIEINVSSYSEENYITPNFTDNLLQKMAETRILILAGGQGFDKGSFIRHLGYKVQSNATSFTLKEIQSNSENQSIYRDILQGDDKVVYMLDQLHPQHLDYDLEKLSRVAQQKKLYLLITTDLSLKTWDLSENESIEYTFTIPTKNLYTQETLVNCLQDNLKKKKDVLKSIFPIKIENIINGELLGKSPNQLARNFETPENISFFVSLLCREKDEVTVERLGEIIVEVNNSSQSLVTKWFRSLDHKQKLVALGVSLLEGMYDDQFFSVMQEVVDGFWKHSNPALLALDYIDLEFLFDYFKLEEIDIEKQILKNRFPNQRTDIIKAAWATHRRHILSILPVLVKIVNQSVNDKASNWEKYGTRQRQMNIRSAISASLGDLGLVSVPVVENALIELASQNNSTLQRVAAKSLARWREFDQDQQLFVTIDNWLKDARIKNLLDDYLAKRNGQSDIRIGSRASSYLKATAVLCLSYSSNYDSPNHLNLEIIRLIKEIASERDELVRTRIQEALPRIIHHHVLQLKDLIVEDLMKFDDLAKSIGEGLAKAYADYPRDLKSTLYQWLENCAETSSQSNQRKKFTYRDKVLVTVFETFQRIEFTNTDQDIITIDEVYSWLLKFDDQEKRKSVRENLYLTLGKIVSLDWSKAEEKLPKFFTPKKLTEVEIIVKKFSLIFLDQRQNLEGAEYEFKWQEELYPAWLSFNERPFTQIEKIMLNWMVSGDIVLKQISTLSFLDFAKVFETDELQKIELLKERVEERRLMQQMIKDRNVESVQNKRVEQYEPAISLWTRIHIFFLLLFEPKSNKITLRAILKLLYKYPNFSKKHLHIVFSKWVRSSDKTTKKLAKWLSRLIS
ncbi:MAG: hypothetical protein MI921_12980 [Cytophagales bacterium]|nr:hypothetical protein [Cytophagales bacterium]